MVQTLKSIKHNKVIAVADGPNTALARPSDWNADHNFLYGADPQTGTTHTILNSHNMSHITYANAASIAVAIAQAGSGGNFPLGWSVWLKNNGAGTVTVTPATSTINGAATLVLRTGQGALLWSDGANYQAFLQRDASGAINCTDTTVSSSTTTGALVIAGGAGIGGSLYVGALISGRNASFDTVTAGMTVASFSGVAANLFVDYTGAGANYYDAAQHYFRTFAAASMVTMTASALTAHQITASSAINNGALVVGGGAGIAGALNVGGSVSVGLANGINVNTILTIGVGGAGTASNNLVINGGSGAAGGGHLRLSKNSVIQWYIGHTNSFTSGTSNNFGMLSMGMAGGAGAVAISIDYTTGNFTIASTTASSSTTTGALIVGGGLGVAGAIHGGSTLNLAGNINSTLSTNTGLLVSLLNSNGGTAAFAEYSAGNGTKAIGFGMRGTAMTTYGILAPSTAYIYGNCDLALLADSTFSILFAGKGSGEKMRLGNGLSIGNTTDPGAGGLRIGNGADAIVTVAQLQVVGAVDAALALRNSTSDAEMYMYVYAGGGILGTMTNHPFTLRVNNIDVATLGAAQLLVTGTILSNAGVIGYTAGAGGTVTQITNKATGVTLNKPNGAITLHNAALAAGASISFLLTNSVISTTSIVAVALSTGYATLATYRVHAEAAGAGSVQITLTNISAGSLSEALVIKFFVLNGSSS